MFGYLLFLARPIGFPLVTIRALPTSQRREGGAGKITKNVS